MSMRRKHKVNNYNYNQKQFAAYVRRQMKERGWNQKELAEAMNVSQAWVSMIVNEKGEAETKTLLSLAGAFGMSVEQLM